MLPRAVTGLLAVLLSLPAASFLHLPLRPHIVHRYFDSAAAPPSVLEIPPASDQACRPILRRFTRRVTFRAWHLIWRHRFPFFLPAWVDARLEKRWVDGQEDWLQDLHILAREAEDREEEEQKEEEEEKGNEGGHRIWSVTGPSRYLAPLDHVEASSISPSSTMSSFVPLSLRQAPVPRPRRLGKTVRRLRSTLRSMLRPSLLFGVERTRVGLSTRGDEDIQEWHLYGLRCREGTVQKEGRVESAAEKESTGRTTKRRAERRGEQNILLGKVGIKVKLPGIGGPSAVCDAGRALFGEGGEEGAAGGPLPVVVLVWCFVPVEFRGRGIGRVMIDMVEEAVVGRGRKEGEEDGGAGWEEQEPKDALPPPLEAKGKGRRRGYVMLTVDDNGSGRLWQYYHALGFRIAPSLSSDDCQIMLRPIECWKR